MSRERGQTLYAVFHQEWKELESEWSEIGKMLQIGNTDRNEREGDEKEADFLTEKLAEFLSAVEV